MEISSKFHRASLKLAKNLTYLKFWILGSVLNARNLDSLLYSLFCLPIVTCPGLPPKKRKVMEIEIFKDLDGKRLVQNVSHAFILSIFNHVGNVSLWLKQHVSLFVFCWKQWCKPCIIFFHQATIIRKNYQRWTMAKRYKHIIFYNIEKTCWLVEVFEVLSVWFQIFDPFFTKTNLSKNES